MCMKNKMRVNISVDKELLEKARSKLVLFGGKLSTLFNAYLAEFVRTMDKPFIQEQKSVELRLKALEDKVNRIEKIKK